MTAERYPERRRVEISGADTQRLTALEWARACVLAGVGQHDAARALRQYGQAGASPDELLASVSILYAVAYELELRNDPALTWAEAQTWDVREAGTGTDPMLEAEARARVETALATGVPLAEAGDVTLAELVAFRDVREEAAKGARRRRSRVHR